MKRALFVIVIALAVAACVATEVSERGPADRPRLPRSAYGTASSSRSSLIISLFTDDIAVYAVPNNGVWYDFGYFVGIVFLGVGARSSKRGR